MIPGRRWVAGDQRVLVLVRDRIFLADLCVWQEQSQPGALGAWGHGQGFTGATAGIQTWGLRKGLPSCGRAKRSKLKEAVLWLKQAPGELQVCLVPHLYPNGFSCCWAGVGSPCRCGHHPGLSWLV